MMRDFAAGLAGRLAHALGALAMVVGGAVREVEAAPRRGLPESFAAGFPGVLEAGPMVATILVARCMRSPRLGGDRWNERCESDAEAAHRRMSPSAGCAPVRNRRRFIDERCSIPALGCGGGDAFVAGEFMRRARLVLRGQCRCLAGSGRLGERERRLGFCVAAKAPDRRSARRLVAAGAARPRSRCSAAACSRCAPACRRALLQTWPWCERVATLKPAIPALRPPAASCLRGTRGTRRRRSRCS